MTMKSSRIDPDKLPEAAAQAAIRGQQLGWSTRMIVAAFMERLLDDPAALDRTYTALVKTAQAPLASSRAALVAAVQEDQDAS